MCVCVSPDLVACAVPYPRWNRAVLLHLFRKLGLNAESLVGSLALGREELVVWLFSITVTHELILWLISLTQPNQAVPV